MTIEECRNSIAWCENQLSLYYASNRENDSQICELNDARAKLTSLQSQMEQAANTGVSRMQNITNLFGICAKKVNSLFNNTESVYKGNEYIKAYGSIASAMGKADKKIELLYGDINYNNGKIVELECSIEYYKGIIAQLEAQGGE